MGVFAFVTRTSNGCMKTCRSGRRCTSTEKTGGGSCRRRDWFAAFSFTGSAIHELVSARSVSYLRDDLHSDRGTPLSTLLGRIALAASVLVSAASVSDAQLGVQ